MKSQLDSSPSPSLLGGQDQSMRPLKKNSLAKSRQLRRLGLQGKTQVMRRGGGRSNCFRNLSRRASERVSRALHPRTQLVPCNSSPAPRARREVCKLKQTITVLRLLPIYYDKKYGANYSSINLSGTDIHHLAQNTS